MDEITLHWYFHSWIQDQEEDIEKMKDFGCFVGSFTNSEMARKIMDKDKNGSAVSVSDEDMDKALQYVKSDTSYKNIKKKKGRIKLNQ